MTDNWWQTEETEKKEYELLADGYYNAVLEDTKLDETTEPAVLTLTFRVTQGEAKGRKLWIRVRFNEASAKFMTWQLGVLGVWSTAKEEKTIQEASRKAAELAYELCEKAHVVLDVSRRTWEGKEYQNAVIKELLATNSSSINADVPNHAPIASPPVMDKSEDLPF